MATNTDRTRGTKPRVSGSTSHSHHRRSSRQVNRSGSTIVRVIVGLLLIGVVVVGIGLGASLFTASDGNKTNLITHTVSRGELLITVTEDGELESAINEDIKCKVKGGTSGGTAILKVVADGTRIIAKADKVSEDQVAVGDVIVEFDRSIIEEQLDTQKITYEKAIALKTQAEKDVLVAEISVEEYIKGIYIKEHQDLEANIRIALENLSSAKSLLAHTDKMFRRGFATQEQLKADKFAVERSELELGSATTAKMVLEKYTKKKMQTDLTSQVETAKARLRSELAALSLEKGRLDRLQAQFQFCIIRAPQTGMVVYANKSSRRGGREVIIEEGTMIIEGQTIIRLPDFSQMQVKVLVHETKIEQVEEGMPARIKILDKQLTGIVLSKANQASPGSYFSSDVKEYETIVTINGDTAGLRPGMTAKVEILIAKLVDVITVPVQAVVEKRGKFFCWVQTETGPQRRPVVIGATDDKVIEIKDGLNEGDDVILNPRALLADARDDDNQTDDDPPKNEFDTSGGQKNSGSPKNGPATGGADKNESSAGTSRRGQFDLMQFDKDGDGKVSQQEAPGSMRSRFDQIDSNGDGFIDKEEFAAEMLRRRGAGGNSGARP